MKEAKTKKNKYRTNLKSTKTKAKPCKQNSSEVFTCPQVQQEEDELKSQDIHVDFVSNLLCVQLHQAVWWRLLLVT